MNDFFKKIFALFVAWVGLCSGCFASCVIIFSGTSTSGKTLTSRELVKRLPNSIDVHFDDYFNDVVAQNYPKDKLTSEDLYGFVRKTSEKVREKVKNSLGKYDYIVCDTCLIDQVDMIACQNACVGHDCYFVLIYCPFTELARRVAVRNKTADRNNMPFEKRYLESVLWEFSNTYRGCCCNIWWNDTEKDANELFLQASLAGYLYDAKESLLERQTVHKTVPKTFSNEWLSLLLAGKTLEQELLEKLMLYEKDYVDVEPRLPFDLIVDNGPLGTPNKCAQTIEKFIVGGGDKRTKTTDCFVTKSRCLLSDIFVPVSRFL